MIGKQASSVTNAPKPRHRCDHVKADVPVAARAVYREAMVDICFMCWIATQQGREIRLTMEGGVILV